MIDPSAVAVEPSQSTFLSIRPRACKIWFTMPYWLAYIHFHVMAAAMPGTTHGINTRLRYTPRPRKLLFSRSAMHSPIVYSAATMMTVEKAEFRSAFQKI